MSEENEVVALRFIDPALFPDRAAVHRFVLSTAFDALMRGLASVILVSEVPGEEVREAAASVLQDVARLARAAARVSTPLKVMRAGGWNHERERADAFLAFVDYACVREPDELSRELHALAKWTEGVR